jgi:hypothetical protein
MSSFRKNLEVGMVYIEGEVAGLNGRPCIAIRYAFMGVTIRVSLENAEQFADAITLAVRRLEQELEPR